MDNSICSGFGEERLNIKELVELINPNYWNEENYFPPDIKTKGYYDASTESFRAYPVYKCSLI